MNLEGADDRTLESIQVSVEPAKTEIGDEHLPVPVYQYVARLQIAMDHAAVVGVLNRVGNFGHDLNCTLRAASGPDWQCVARSASVDRDPAP